MRAALILALCAALRFIPGDALFAQASEDSLKAIRSKATKIFFDCQRCDLDYIKTNVSFVNYVRDRQDAQVHVLVTTQRTGSGGTEYTLTFIGQKNFSGINDTLKYFSNKTNTEDEIRHGIARTLKMGLIRYISKTPFADQVDIAYKETTKATDVVDPWNFWVFRINLDSFLNGQKSSKSTNIFGSVSADRITDAWKIRLSARSSYREDKFSTADFELTSITRRYSGRAIVVKSLTDHWSVGGTARGSSSTYSNIDLRLDVAPAIEYNLFPYSESTRRQLRFLYEIAYRYADYVEVTIFDKSVETLMQQRLSVTLETWQTWGSMELSLEGANYFHDLSKNRIELFSRVDLRLYKGLSLSLWGSVSRISDQLSLRKRDIPPEEVLLRTSELATTYSYFGSIGVNFTFGSIYSNVVNARFGN